MADALVSVVLEQFASILEQEARLVVGVDEETQKLTSNLRAIQAVLDDAEKRQVKEDTIRDWLFKLKDASYEIDDVLDEWRTAILKSEIEKKENEVENSLALKKKVYHHQYMARSTLALPSLVPLLPVGLTQS